MFDYLSASIGPVVEGLEDFEKIYALEQAEYIPLRTLPGEDGQSAITRWGLSDAQRKAIAEGADIFLEVIHFRGPLAPVRMAIGKQENDAALWNEWFASQTRGPYLPILSKMRKEKADGTQSESSK
jgi:hypothetical protein